MTSAPELRPEEPEPRRNLTRAELIAVTHSLADRLLNAAACAGCNDVCRDEFAESVCARYRSDVRLIGDWLADVLAVLRTEVER